MFVDVFVAMCFLFWPISHDCYFWDAVEDVFFWLCKLLKSHLFFQWVKVRRTSCRTSVFHFHQRNAHEFWSIRQQFQWICPPLANRKFNNRMLQVFKIEQYCANPGSSPQPHAKTADSTISISISFEKGINKLDKKNIYSIINYEVIFIFYLFWFF